MNNIFSVDKRSCSINIVNIINCVVVINELISCVVNYRNSICIIIWEFFWVYKWYFCIILMCNFSYFCIICWDNDLVKDVVFLSGFNGSGNYWFFIKFFNVFLWNMFIVIMCRNDCYIYLKIFLNVLNNVVLFFIC